jgi:hypothetical protein
MNYQKNESEMDFSFLEQSVFDLEKSDVYSGLSKGNGIKVIDFILHNQRNDILLIEAKKNSPNLGNPASKEKVSEYTHNIHLKTVHSLLLLLGLTGLRSYKYPSNPPEWINLIKKPSTKIIPVLVIKKSKKEWLPPIADCLRKELSGTRKAYGLEDILVLNEEMARQKGYIK